MSTNSVDAAAPVAAPHAASDEAAASLSSLSLQDAGQDEATARTAANPSSPLPSSSSNNVRAPTGGPPRPSVLTTNSQGSTSSPSIPSRGGPPPRTGGPPGGSGGPMNAQERARQMAGTKLPPSLQAKLAANAARSSSSAPTNPNQLPSYLKSNQRIDPSSILARGGPNGAPSIGGGPPFPPSSGPGMNGLAARRAGGFPGGLSPAFPGSNPGVGPPAAGIAGRRPKPGLKLSDMGITSQQTAASTTGAQQGADGGAATRSVGGTVRAPPPGRLSAAPKGGLMSSAFSEFADVIDPSGRLNFAGKAVLHEKGVEFGNGTSFKINMDDLELQDVLGKGNYGEVRKVRHTKTGVEMAMKEIRLELDTAKLNAIIMELDILHRAVAPEIVEFYGAFFVESCVFYCIEFMDAGSLENLYDGPSSVPEDVLARIVSRMVKGLAFLKDDLQIMHRDVKPTNVLVNRRGEVKLCDFGVSGQLEKSLAKTNIGCQSYMAPERIKGESLSMPSTYTVASDVWSLGLSIVETTLGVYPYPPETYSNVFAQLQAIVHGDPPRLPDDYSEVAQDFVAGCLEKVPERRVTYSQMLQHPWLLADEKRGPDGVNMMGWVEGALVRRSERRKEMRAKEAAVQAKPIQ